MNRVVLHLVSDFNLEVLGRYLSRSPDPPPVDARPAPFGQVYQVLSAGPGGAGDDALVWTTPEGVLATYARAASLQEIPLEEVLAEVDRFGDALLAARKRVRHLFVVAWTKPAWMRGYGMLEMRTGLGLANTLARMNLRLCERLEADPGIFVLDPEPWIRAAGARAFSPKLWYAGKIPFGNPVFQEAAGDIRAALLGLAGKARKLILVDLDDTLWGGIVGETGWKGLNLGGHDLEGEAFVGFQKALKAMMARGIQLGIVSKNEESVALEAIDNHPEMQLRRDDFVGWRINWNDKAANIADLVAEVNLGLDSVVFLDDNPAERGRVREALPEVLTPDWPRDKTRYAEALNRLRCFDSPALSAEDRARARMYLAERKRAGLKSEVSSPEEWLAGLDVRVEREELGGANLPRAAQLLNKTNQMNMATRRLSQAELDGWAAGEDRRLWTFRVRDRFGDSGLTGIISLERDGDTARVVDFILSCRVMGRKVEETMVHTAVEQARTWGATAVVAEHLPTERNLPCLKFWRRSGFEPEGEYLFRWDASRPYPLPDTVTLVISETV